MSTAPLKKEYKYALISKDYKYLHDIALSFEPEVGHHFRWQHQDGKVHYFEILGECTFLRFQNSDDIECIEYNSSGYPTLRVDVEYEYYMTKYKNRVIAVPKPEVKGGTCEIEQYG